MLTCGIISKYFLKFFGNIIIQPKLFILIGHDDDPWQSIEALKDLWGSNFPQKEGQISIERRASKTNV
jgi:hypothetical protein